MFKIARKVEIAVVLQMKSCDHVTTEHGTSTMYDTGVLALLYPVLSRAVTLATKRYSDLPQHASSVIRMGAISPESGGHLSFFSHVTLASVSENFWVFYIALKH